MGMPKVLTVKFDNLYSPLGTRMDDAIGLNFSPFTSSTQEIDDFTDFDRGLTPFHIRPCVLEWNPYTSKFDIISYKDNNPYSYSTICASSTGIRCIEFPKFYYKFYDFDTFSVCSEYKQGYSISPMHVSNGVVSDYVYIGEFMINSNGDMSQPGTPMVNKTISEFRSLANSKHCHLMNIFCTRMISMLACIKYASLDFKTTIGDQFNVDNNVNQQYSSITGLDGMKSNNVKILGINDLYGNIWQFLDGASIYLDSSSVASLYLNNNLSISRFPENRLEAKDLGWLYSSDLIISEKDRGYTHYTYYDNNTLPRNRTFNMPETLSYITMPLIKNFWELLYYNYKSKFFPVVYGGMQWKGVYIDKSEYKNDNQEDYTASNCGARIFIPSAFM